MKKWVMGVLFLFIVALLTAGCGQTAGKFGQNTAVRKEITVSAAISLKDALAKIKTDYEKAHPDVKITYNLGASGDLQKQIEQGAPVDLFISAGASQMNQLNKEGLIDPSTRLNLLSNDLVLITPQNGPQIKDLAGLAGPAVKRIALGAPKTVPAGKYAEETLNSAKLLPKLQPKLVYANTVRAVLTDVETGNVDAGFVYHSDALVGKNIKVALTVPDNLHKTIVYPAAVVKNAGQKAAAREFLNYLASPRGMQVFEQFGLKPGKK